MKKSEISFIFDGFRRVDMGDQETGSNEYGDTHEQRGHIDHCDDWQIEFHWNHIHIIGFRVKFYDSSHVLQHAQTDAKKIADDHAFDDDEDRKP